MLVELQMSRQSDDTGPKSQTCEAELNPSPEIPNLELYVKCRMEPDALHTRLSLYPPNRKHRGVGFRAPKHKANPRKP